MPSSAFETALHAHRQHAVIVDERFNGGGRWQPTYRRNPEPQSAQRRFEIQRADPSIQPQGIFGPKVMIINERAGSGGDAMPRYFKRSPAWGN